MERRAHDPRINVIEADVKHLHDCVEGVKSELQRNTEVTEQVRDILATFRVSMAIAKWIASISAAVAGAYAAVKSFK